MSKGSATSSLTASRGTALAGSGLAWWAAATIFVSAFLLFQVQPIISKMILPWFGGSPAVWTTCVLFFQLVLLAGYAYAHALIRYVPPSRQGIVHGCLLALAILTLPITPSEWWKPKDGSLPALRILMLLLAEVGLPYFLLSSSGPLVQAWFAKVYPNTSPYRLYSLSNVGSLLALLTYPFFFEPLLGASTQGWMWSGLFLLFALLAGFLGYQVSRLFSVPAVSNDPDAPNSEVVVEKKPAEEIPPPSMGLVIAWILLPALASMLLLATTNRLCEDIAVVPVLLVVPLALYLVSFILCFDSEIWYQRKLWGPLGVLGILALCALLKGGEWSQTALPEAPTRVKQYPAYVAKVVAHYVTGVLPTSYLKKWSEDFNDSKPSQGIVFTAVLFVICMLCHGELVKLKPRPQQLTLYYLLISVGGALGGLFVALICPFIFKLHFELSLGIVLGYIVAWIAVANDGRHSWLQNRQWLQWSAAFVIMGGALLVFSSTYEKVPPYTVAIVRNFYGPLTVKERLSGDDLDGDGKEDREAFSLVHGGILHGFQFTDPSRRFEATTYYVNDSGAGVAVRHFPRSHDAQGKDNGIRVGVVGLGAGTMAAHAQRDDVYRFYEIDPKVIALSKQYFTFRSDAEARGAKTEVVQGDARIQMEQEPDQNYDVIALDAFSGDAIPAHLLTVESMKQYLRHLRKDDKGIIQGILAIHISNRHLDLAPVVAALARRNHLTAIQISVDADTIDGDAFTGSDWILLTQNKTFLDGDIVSLNVFNIRSGPLQIAEKDEVLWTDQHSSLLPILKAPWVVKLRNKVLGWLPKR